MSTEYNYRIPLVPFSPGCLKCQASLSELHVHRTAHDRDPLLRPTSSCPDPSNSVAVAVVVAVVGNQLVGVY